MRADSFCTKTIDLPSCTDLQQSHVIGTYLEISPLSFDGNSSLLQNPFYSSVRIKDELDVKGSGALYKMSVGTDTSDQNSEFSHLRYPVSVGCSMIL